MKSGMTIGKPPKAGVDMRPWECYPEDDDTVLAIHCWYEETAAEVCNQRHGWVYSQREGNKILKLTNYSMKGTRDK